MPIIRWHDQRPNDIINPATNRISMGICCPIQTMGFHGFVDEDEDPVFTIMQQDQTFHYELAHDDVDPERAKIWAAKRTELWHHENTSRRGTYRCWSDDELAALTQEPIHRHPGPRPRSSCACYWQDHPTRGRERVWDGRPLASLNRTYNDVSPDGLSWEDVVNMIGG